MRRSFRPTALVFIALASILLAACAPTSADNGGPASSATDAPITVGLTYIPNVQFAPVYVADSQGLFADQGLGVALRHHGAEEGLFNALLSGDEQITIASGDEVLPARAQGADLVAIGAYYHHYPVQVLVPADSDIKDLRDLRGMKVGLPGEYGSNWFGLLAALESAGLSVGDVQVVSVGYTQSAALLSGEVDAIVGFSNSEAVQLELLGFPARALPMGDLPLVGATIVTTQRWLDANPEAAEAVVTSITEGVQVVLDDPEVGLEATETWDPTLSDATSRANAAAILEATLPLWQDTAGNASPTQDLDTWRLMAPFLANVLDQPLIADTFAGAVTNAFASQQ